MKKGIVFGLLVACFFTLFACSATTVQEKSKIDLSGYNIYSYLNYSVKFGEMKSDSLLGYPTAERAIEISIFPKVPGDFYDANVTVEFELPTGWSEKSTNEEKITHSCNLTSSGTATIIKTISALGYWDDREFLTVKFTNARGTFIAK